MVKRRYSTTVRLFKYTGGQIDPATSGYISGSRVISYEGKANVQEVGLNERFQFEKTSMGSETASTDIKIYFKRNIINEIDLGQDGEVEYENGDKFSMHVTGINRTSGSVYCKYV